MQELKSRLHKHAKDLGFDLFGVASVDDPVYAKAFRHYETWLEDGRAGTMQYLHDHVEDKRDPANLLPGVRSIVCVGMNHAPDPLTDDGKRAFIAAYARGRDYHSFLKDRLRELSARFRAECGEAATWTYTDSQPMMDRFWATRAGIGWLGKNTCLIDRKIGSYMYLGGFLTTVELAPDAPATDHCGKCRKCIDACPTAAIHEPKTADERHFIDATACIGYHTIENKDEIPEEIMKNMGRWVAGCDICQQVCPWNDPPAPAPEFETDNPLWGKSLVELAAMERKEYRSSTKGTALERVKYQAFLRNVLIAGMNGDAADRLTIQSRVAFNEAVCAEEIRRLKLAANPDVDRLEAEETGARGLLAALKWSKEKIR